MVSPMERALIIRQPWLDLILSGKKTWEMRSRPTSVRGRIGLIEQGSGLIVGEVNLDDCLPSIKGTVLKLAGFNNHRVSNFSLLDKWHYPWVLSGAIKYEKPLPYQHPQGAVTWVKLQQ